MMRSALCTTPLRESLFAILAGGLTLLASAPASAKRTAATADSEGEAPATNDQKAASQANDVERPKTILDTNQEAPKTDSLGRVHFASPSGEGLGRVVVNAPAEAKVNVFLEGRFFGTAPVTIFSVPKGDYILEANYPSGKQVSKPVTVSENEETAIDLGGARALKSGDSASGAEMTANRTFWMRGLAIGSVAALAFGVTFGILELKAQSNYENTPSTNQAQLDSLRTTGQRDAAFADVGYIVAAAGAIGATICALPMFFGPNTNNEKPAGFNAMVVTPTLARGTTGGALLVRF